MKPRSSGWCDDDEFPIFYCHSFSFQFVSQVFAVIPDIIRRGKSYESETFSNRTEFLQASEINTITSSVYGDGIRGEKRN